MERPKKTLQCENCKHEACLGCTPRKWGMAEIEGMQCCVCRKTWSLSAWESGTRNKCDLENR